MSGDTQLCYAYSSLTSQLKSLHENMYASVCVLLTSGTLCWRSSGSGSASTMGVVGSRALSSTEGEFSSRQGLPGMIPADLAARSMAPGRVLIVQKHKGFVTSASNLIISTRLAWEDGPYRKMLPQQLNSNNSNRKTASKGNGGKTSSSSRRR